MHALLGGKGHAAKKESSFAWLRGAVMVWVFLTSCNFGNRIFWKLSGDLV